MVDVTITRHYTAGNVDDRFSLGSHEHEGNASLATYSLPEGYRVVAGKVRDPDGVECAIALGPDGGPQVMSLAGSRPDVALSSAA